MELRLTIRKTTWYLNNLSMLIKGPKRELLVSSKGVNYKGPDKIKIKKAKAEKAIANYFAKSIVAEQAKVKQAREDGTDIHGFVETTIYIPKDDNEIESENEGRWSKSPPLISE